MEIGMVLLRQRAPSSAAGLSTSRQTCETSIRQVTKETLVFSCATQNLPLLAGNTWEKTEEKRRRQVGMRGERNNKKCFNRLSETANSTTETSQEDRTKVQFYVAHVGWQTAQ